jgi:hypothetical protein
MARVYNLPWILSSYLEGQAWMRRTSINNTQQTRKVVDKNTHLFTIAPSSTNHTEVDSSLVGLPDFKSGVGR